MWIIDGPINTGFFPDCLFTINACIVYDKCRMVPDAFRYQLTKLFLRHGSAYNDVEQALRSKALDSSFQH